MVHLEVHEASGVPIFSGGQSATQDGLAVMSTVARVPPRGAAGQVIFRMRRPMYLINSSIYVEVSLADPAAPWEPFVALPCAACSCPPALQQIPCWCPSSAPSSV